MKRFMLAFAALALAYAPALAAERSMLVRRLPNPQAFLNVAQITNPYLPMTPPGTTFVYDGFVGSQAEHNLVTITHKTGP